MKEQEAEDIPVKSQFLAWFPDLGNVQIQNPLTEEVAVSVDGRTLWHGAKTFHGNSSCLPEPKWPTVIYLSDWTLRKGNYPDISFTLRSGDAKCHHGPPVTVRAHVGQAINGDQANHGPAGSVMVICSDLECITRTVTLGSWSKVHIGSLDYGFKVLRVEMAKWKPSKGPRSCITAYHIQGIRWRLVSLL